MYIDSKKLSGPCSCGLNHQIITRGVIIEPGCLKKLDHFLSAYGLTGKRAAVYDRNTFQAEGLTQPGADQEIILNPTGLHADEKATAEIFSQLAPDIKLLIAVGGGAIHDTVRYCAHELGIPFVSCPTAASVDGFCSTVSAMTWEGYKKTMPGIAPSLVLADLDVIKKAPMRLALSGVGDMFGKYTALADWKIAHILTKEPFCPVIEGMTREAVSAVFTCCEGLKEEDEEAFSQLMYGLLLSGLAMQMMGNSRPASGAEHHISHLIEMEPPFLRVHSHALHGEKVGVGALLVSQEYHRLALIEDIGTFIRPYRFLTSEMLLELYGEKLLPSVLAENKNICMESITPKMLAIVWSDICNIIQEIPRAEDLLRLYKKIGAKSTLEDIEVPSDRLEDLLSYSPTVRNRLTLMRVRRMFTAGDQRKLLLKKTKLFVLDLDGTFYLGSSILPGALKFLFQAERAGKQYLFFTNNASASPELYRRKLAGMGCSIRRDQLMTSGDVTIRYLNTTYPGKSVYLLGTPALRESFEKAGILLTDEQPDLAVVSFDKTLTYERLERCCTFIRNGAVFLATHPDVNCPTEDGFIPDCGAICAAISLSTGKQPKYMGKPYVETVSMILQTLGIEKEHTAFVGDRLYTDVAAGAEHGARGFLVLTGETKWEDLTSAKVKPDAVFHSLGEMGQLLDEL